MSADKLDTWLEQTLAEQEPYLDDDGFTFEVMAHLPVPVSRRRLWLANLTVGLVVALLVALVFPWGNLISALAELGDKGWLTVAASISGVFTAAVLAGGYWSYQRGS